MVVSVNILCSGRLLHIVHRIVDVQCLILTPLSFFPHAMQVMRSRMCFFLIGARRYTVLSSAGILGTDALLSLPFDKTAPKKCTNGPKHSSCYPFGHWQRNGRCYRGIISLVAEEENKNKLPALNEQYAATSSPFARDGHSSGRHMP